MPVAGNGEGDRLVEARIAMVELQLRRRGIRDPRVLAAMAQVPRHLFVPPQHAAEAYGDHPIPIGAGQTISQPYIVAVMLQALALDPQHVVLEVGAGSGYQTALLCELAARVYSIERVPLLAAQAEERLQRLGYQNVEVRVADGTLGLPEAAPFDAIIVAAAAPRIPEPLQQQLRLGGRMVLPVGGPEAQELQLVTRHAGGHAVQRLDACRFVPLLGESGYRPDDE